MTAVMAVHAGEYHLTGFCLPCTPFLPLQSLLPVLKAGSKIQSAVLIQATIFMPVQCLSSDTVSGFQPLDQISVDHSMSIQAMSSQ